MKAITIPSASPWRQPMVWLVVAGPVSVVIASFFTLSLAIRRPDPPLELRHSQSQAADDVADLRAREGDPVPALVARNHAATGTAGLKK